MRWLATALFAGLVLPGAALAQNLVACGHPIYPPLSWDQDGELKGVAPHVVQHLFGELGYSVELAVRANWKRCLREARAGQVDIVVSAYITDERLEYLSYANDYVLDDPVAIFVNRERRFAFNTLEDLQHKTAGLLLGDSFGDQYDQFVRRNGRVEWVSSGEQNFAKLALGRIDYMPLGRETGRLQSLRLKLDTQIEPLPRSLTTEHYYIAVRRGGELERHLPYINRRLGELRADGSLSRLKLLYSRQYLAPQPQAPAHD
ncbi:substrate-binding periplasmic protein [Marinobacterium rhizophilum]|uniref:Transporter substrate-binding domain-containing protein n=1 Tax=Marinobacterium rhizophilum TaxID=420402 RepID=A0ABY5HNC0_9GAMM|nr:transporter substrate-binding domain-containing protein [Marinobacterium rhizophilum]UTW12737.1 transporter substrate-binding domain-containing protein [Marinobacterium rhizophilum]